MMTINLPHWQQPENPPRTYGLDHLVIDGRSFFIAGHGTYDAVPSLGTATDAATITIAYDGSLAIYTLLLTNSPGRWYPGVYEWRPA